jgi:PTS system N-acetylglucosamine-specific IIC component
MYHTAKDSKKKAAASLLLAGSLASFFTGITEPLEFAFMFMAPGLYLVHAVLTGISAVICTLLPLRLGFNFSAGFVDYILSFKAPMAVNPLLLIPVGLVFAVIYYFVFRFVIIKWDLKTPGREDDEEDEEKIELAKKAIARGKLSLEEIAETLSLPLAFVQELARPKAAMA